jgi:hypothetical protein
MIAIATKHPMFAPTLFCRTLRTRINHNEG